MAEAKRDNNYIPTLIAVSNVDGETPVTLYADPTTHRLLVSASNGSLENLTDVVITSEAQGDILYYNGTAWVNLVAGDSGKFLKTQGTGANPIWDTVSTAVSSLDDVGDVTITSIASGELLKWNGSAWINNTLAEAGVQAQGDVLDDLNTLGATASDGQFIVATGAGVFAYESGATVRTSLGLGTAAVVNTDLSDLNEATIETAIDTLANLTSIQGRTVTLADAGADAIFGWDDSANAYENLTAAEVRTVINVENGADVTDTANVTSAGALMDSELTDIAAVKALSDASISDTNTGTSTTAFVTPDGLSGSDFGIRMVQAQIVEGATDTAVGDGIGNYRFFVPAQLNGYNLVVAHAAVVTAGTTGTTDIQIHNVTQAADMLSTKITIDSGEKTSYTAATAPVINAANDNVSTGDEIRIDGDAVSTTPAKGLSIILGFQLP